MGTAHLSIVDLVPNQKQEDIIKAASSQYLVNTYIDNFVLLAILKIWRQSTTSVCQMR